MGISGAGGLNSLQPQPIAANRSQPQPAATNVPGVPGQPRAGPKRCVMADPTADPAEGQRLPHPPETPDTNGQTPDTNSHRPDGGWHSGWQAQLRAAAQKLRDSESQTSCLISRPGSRLADGSSRPEISRASRISSSALDRAIISSEGNCLMTS